ncbi:tRNA uracil 4-sulfurtransferase ThiI [Alicyclobacillus sp. ALC3]|uniref:tRNA uracil 4-sulfurtransferase ThiI n=1 Tax=Alicyclobacillus sp. ALC3 TaxID=2796143 RepID=UPI00237964E6|nr:tRNA uracil 4-sulfurtransferase ThiI [Alicyclobacillus sp. ALC3]WDL99289.1 tRNA 4-thiouridine(8) synthase ThiI [Alicyclobacillus sp. ALC3]
MAVDQLIVRYGEISLKGHNRSDFEKILAHNVQRALRAFEGVRVERIGGRISVHLAGNPAEPVTREVCRVFGVVSVSPVERTELSVEALTAAALAAARQAVLSSEQVATTFKVDVRRANKRFPIPSPELAALLGGRILEEIESLRVDVHHPHLTVYVEVRDEGGFVYASKYAGLGGLPVGSSGRVGLLLSGGIDSPVAGWLAMKRGVELEAIHFHSFPFTSERALQKVEDLAQVLANWGGRVRLHVVHFTEVQTEIRKHCPDELSITVMRRMMLRIAERLATQWRLKALVTGESLGQVASQTLDSMKTINAVTNLPILRPLVTEDKVDIMRRAREIGTYDISILPYEDCCTIFVPKSPRTKPKIDEAERAETSLDVEKLVEDAVAQTEQKMFKAQVQRTL